MEDRFIKYLQQYYEQHKTINDIKRTAVVDFEGSPLKIGEFLASIRKQRRLYIKNDPSRGAMTEKAIARYHALNDMHFTWEPAQKNTKHLDKYDICLIYIEKHYETFHSFEHIREKIEVQGKIYNVKNFINHIRANHRKYISGQNSNGSNSPTSLRRYAKLDAINFDWNPKETKRIMYENEDKYMIYVERFYQKHKTLEGLPKKVVFYGTELNIENFITDRRNAHREMLNNPDYTPSELENKRHAALEAMNLDWNPKETKHQELMENDAFMRYLAYHYQMYGTINNIKAKQIVEFEGNELKIGDFINDMRKKRQAFIEGRADIPAIKTPLALKRYQELDDMGFDWRPSETTISIAKLARSNGLKTNTLKNYIKRFNGDIDKALKICKAVAKQKKINHKKTKRISPTMATIAKEFEIDMSTLSSLLNRPSLRISESHQVLMYDENTNLRQYCLDQGLNYTVIQKAIKLRMKDLAGEDLQSLINRCIVEYKLKGQARPSTWIYSKYGNEILVTHLLTYLNLDAEAILRDMSNNCLDLFEAIENNSFVRSSKNNYDYLEFFYRQMIRIYKKTSSIEKNKDLIAEVIEEKLNNFVTEYNLTPEEKKVLSSSTNRYINAEEQYKLFNVGFEKDEDIRIKKIIDYGLDEDEIEEAFFMPLKFDQRALIGRDSELYKRRVLLKNITVSWNYASKEERKEKILKYNLTSAELDYIEITRKEIDNTKQKVLLQNKSSC